jgi:hypothetical protein
MRVMRLHRWHSKMGFGAELGAKPAGLAIYYSTYLPHFAVVADTYDPVFLDCNLSWTLYRPEAKCSVIHLLVQPNNWLALP